MKLHPLTPLLAPPLWAYSAGFAFGSLAAALGSEHPEIVTTSFRAVGFVLAFPVVGYMMTKSQEGNPQDLTRRDWQKIREQYIEQEKATTYASDMRPGSVALGVANGKQTKVFHFPAGITLDHLTAFGDLVASGKPPRYRNLKTSFDHKLWSQWRDWLMVAELNKYTVLAEYTSGRDEWDVTKEGRKLAIIWRCQASPTPLLSSAKKCMIEGNKTKNKQ